MTVTIADQIDRIEYLLQDRQISGHDKAFARNVILTQHADEVTRLARHDLWGNVAWMNALAGTGQYTLPSSATAITMVLYNENRIDFATEAMLDHWHAGWEEWVGEPQFWLIDNQSPNVLRIVPTPLRDGSALPLIPGPLVQNPIDNLLVFFYEDRSDSVGDESDTLPLADVFEDLLVYETTAELASRETDYQNLPLAAACRDVAALYRKSLGVL